MPTSPAWRWRCAAAAVLAYPLLLGGGAACQHQRPHTTIRIALESEVLSLDPVAVTEVATTSVLGNFYEGLVGFDKDMAIVPALAVSWNAVDEHTWVFQLRSGVRFHDGTRLAAKDVKASLERARDDTASALKAYLSNVLLIETSGEATLRIRTGRPDPLLLGRLTYVPVAPAAAQRTLAARPIGTGPYRFVSWARGSHLDAEAFEDYWNGRPAIDSVRFLSIEEGERSVRALREGSVDVLRWVPDAMLEQARAVPGYRVRVREGLSAYYFWLDSRRPQPAGGPANPFADRRVRQAISLAIDRQELVSRLGSTAIAANQLVHSGVFGYLPGLPPLAFDPDRARRLLAEAGYGRGFDTTLVRRPQATVVAASETVQRMLGRVGIRVRIETREWPELLEAWTAGRLPFFVAAWRFDDGDASSFLRDCLFTRDPARRNGGFNPGYTNPELDRLIEENEQVLERGARLSRYQGLMRLALEEMPLVPLFIRTSLYAASNRVRWEPRLDGNLLAAEMSLAP